MPVFFPDYLFAVYLHSVMIGLEKRYGKEDHHALACGCYNKE